MAFCNNSQLFTHIFQSKYKVLVNKGDIHADIDILLLLLLV